MLEKQTLNAFGYILCTVHLSISYVLQSILAHLGAASNTSNDNGQNRILGK